MDTLIRFGFSIEEIQTMMNTNHSIDEISDNDILDLIDLLKDINCKEEQIKNIFLCNPFYITNKKLNIKKLLKKLKEIGFTNIDLLLESNPYLLNMEEEELDRIYNKKIHEGFSKEEIIDYINYNEVI